MGNQTPEVQTGTREQPELARKSPEADLGQTKSEADKYQMYIEYGNESTETHTFLVNGARVNIDALVAREWIDRKAQELQAVDRKAADGVDMSDAKAAEQRIHEQLSQSRLEAIIINRLAVIFRSYEDQIGLLKRKFDSAGKTESVGLDQRQVGNMIDFSNPDDMFFTISEDGVPKMRELLYYPPKDLDGEQREQFTCFRPPTEDDYLYDDVGARIGFTVQLNKAENAEGPKHIFFLFAKDKKQVAEEKSDIKAGKVDKVVDFETRKQQKEESKTS